ncbi:response regulator [Pseudomonas sp. GD03842]|nr:MULTISPECIES: response regulator [unclassified Pseudomonas]MDH0748197.1 response regulator [Pseudomonas sp. GD03842]RAU47626.1 response regulator [Pseudomonas sp. RIT 409]RAU52034.1 response regulator [Pseudomonas sp. RIT 412]
MKTVLIVDDEYLIADILSFALEEEGFLPVTAASALRALDILERERPDLIITDFMMPGMTGVEFAEKVKSTPGFERTPMMLMSGAQAHLGIARPDLFTAVFLKPFDTPAVVRQIRLALDSKRP